MDKIQKFVIVSIPRTGSNLMVGLLDSHPEIICHYELFHKDEIFHSSKYGREFLGDFDAEKRDRKLRKFLKIIWKNTFDKSAKAIGFKIFKDHNPKAMEKLLKDRKVKKFILKRNLLFSYLSKKEAQKSGVFVVTKNENIKKEPPKTEFNHNEFRTYEQNMKSFFEYTEGILNKKGQQFLAVNYEDLLKKEEQKKWLEFLGIEPDTSKMEVLFKKQNVRPPEDRISNYEEAAENLKNTEYEKYFK